MRQSLARQRDLGLLIVRLVLGPMFILHGLPKILEGPERWEKLGGAMGYLGIHFVPALWGLLAALTETIGGVCLLLGFLFRPACVLLFCVMAVATNLHISRGDSFAQLSHPIEVGAVFLGLTFLGPGRHSLDRR